MKLSESLKHIVEDEITLAAIDKVADSHFGKMLRNKAINKELLAEHIYQSPPAHDSRAEEEFVGRLLKFPTQSVEFLAVRSALSEELFYSQQFRTIYSAIIYRYEEGKSINCDAIIAELREAGELTNCGGEEQIRLLVVGIESPQGIEEYGEALISNWEMRQMWAQAAQAVTDIQHLSISEAATYREDFIQRLSNLSNLHQSSKGGYDGESLADELQRELEVFSTQTEIAHPTHLDKLNQHTSGWAKTDLIIVAARPAMGKTSYALADMMCALDNGEPCVFFSLEMGKTQLCWRMLSIYYEIPDIMNRLKSKSLTDADLALFQAFLVKLRTWKLWIIDDLFYLHQITAKAKVLAKLYGIKRMYADYIQLIQILKMFSVEQATAEVSRTLKLLAKELQVVLMALSQLSREVEKRADKRPNLSDLRYSGAIEQDADMVIFLYRPEYYGLLQDEDGESLKGVGELIISKYRAGALGTVRAFFNAPCVKWDNIEKLQDSYSNDTIGWWEDQSQAAQPVHISNTHSNSDNEDLKPSSQLEWQNLD